MTVNRSGFSRVEPEVSEIDDLVGLFRREYPAMVGVATLLLGDRSGAEDVVQEAFLRVFAKRKTDGGYLRTTVLNLARGRLRRISVSGRAFRAERRAERTPEDLAVEGDEHARVMQALAGLPDRQRECAVLKYYLDLSEREIAEALGLAQGSVKSHLHRARAALERALEVR